MVKDSLNISPFYLFQFQFHSCFTLWQIPNHHKAKETEPGPHLRQPNRHIPPRVVVLILW